MLITFSRTLSHIPHLEAFLGERVQWRILPPQTPPDAVVGWGHKPFAERARRYAAQKGIPYIAVEDGFLRSLELGARHAPPLSLVVDGSGIYYDASAPSDLENLLNSKGWETPELLASARQAMADIRTFCLSKYNHAPAARPDLLGRGDVPRVLIIDQSYGDSSVTLGQAGEESFIRMLEEARSRFPHGRIFVKTHPDTLAGFKRGYLDGRLPDGVTRIACDVAPLSLLAQADAVFCVTSQMGMEALLLSKPVYCFGMPFYAGWGLTTDALSCPRRVQRRTLEELFAAAYLCYPRYINPVSGERCDIHNVIRRLALQREKNEANRGPHACFGFSGWKHPHAQACLQSTGASFRFFKHFDGQTRALAWAVRHEGDVVAWASKCPDDTLERRCQEQGRPFARMEDGFIRSVGLGSNFQLPYSLTIDRSGIYYDPSRPSDLEHILNTISRHPGHAELCARARALQQTLVHQRITKYNVGENHVPTAHWPKDRRILLVPGQVEDDASVRTGGCGISGNLELLRKVRELHPDSFIVYKTHPDVESGNRKGKIDKGEVLSLANEMVRDVHMGVLLSCVDEVHTLTSLSGFEALLRGVKVCTYGGPFYAGWGLTEDFADPASPFFARRRARLILDELVAGALLLYPTYYDWLTRSFCLAEDVVHYRLLQHPVPASRSLLARLLSAARAWLRM
ncbi:MAG: capsular polysaccharide biosynthesis protein [Deltaproteobacteria bacterium]|nr:capsular polysaccharide biosynthesis protein [Deltaproteobacteria bacterium]